MFAAGEEPPEAGGPGGGSAAPSIGKQTLPAVKKLIGQKTLIADSNQRQRLVAADGPMPSVRWSDHYGFGKSSAFNY